MMSSGMALIAADSTTIANPVWIQTMITMSRNVFSGWDRIQFGGLLPAQRDRDLAEQADCCGCDGIDRAS